jgi:hypothetical protein
MFSDCRYAPFRDDGAPQMPKLRVTATDNRYEARYAIYFAHANKRAPPTTEVASNCAYHCRCTFIVVDLTRMTREADATFYRVKELNGRSCATLAASKTY